MFLAMTPVVAPMESIKPSTIETLFNAPEVALGYTTNEMTNDVNGEDQKALSKSKLKPDPTLPNQDSMSDTSSTPVKDDSATTSVAAECRDNANLVPAVEHGIDLRIPPATLLKNRLENTKDLIVCPGVYDGLSARVALSVGFDALYMVSPPPSFPKLHIELTGRRPEPGLQSRHWECRI